jgi:hypothetical protein
MRLSALEAEGAKRKAVAVKTPKDTSGQPRSKTKKAKVDAPSSHDVPAGKDSPSSSRKPPRKSKKAFLDDSDEEGEEKTPATSLKRKLADSDSDNEENEHENDASEKLAEKKKNPSKNARAAAKEEPHSAHVSDSEEEEISQRIEKPEGKNKKQDADCKLRGKYTRSSFCSSSMNLASGTIICQVDLYVLYIMLPVCFVTYASTYNMHARMLGNIAREGYIHTRMHAYLPICTQTGVRDSIAAGGKPLRSEEDDDMHTCTCMYAPIHICTHMYIHAYIHRGGCRSSAR